MTNPIYSTLRRTSHKNIRGQSAPQFNALRSLLDVETPAFSGLRLRCEPFSRSGREHTSSILLE
jgi:hypothetical protein